MNPLQTRMATLGLRALAPYGFVLAGGYALQAHGFGDRESDDIDLFTNDLDPGHFAEAVDLLVAAYRSAGLHTEVVRRAPLFARLVVESTVKADLGVDHRQQPPVTMEIGAVLSEADAIGSKVGAVYSRLEPRDFIDVQFVLDSGRYDRDTLLELADHREANPLDRQMFAGQLRAGARLPDSGFARYGAHPEQISRIRRTASEWAATLTDGRMDGPSGTIGS
ncbi:nucleotidyl transferase AbiEii/AbiGii toxin family protein [Kribbella sp. NPDC055110]